MYRNSDEKYYRENTYKWMSNDQFECWLMLCDLCSGSHHVFGTVRPCGEGISIILKSGFQASTFDFNGMTQAVIMAHDRCIRFSIHPGNAKCLQLVFHKRHCRTGDMSKRHPTLEQSIKALR